MTDAELERALEDPKMRLTRLRTVISVLILMLCDLGRAVDAETTEARSETRSAWIFSGSNELKLEDYVIDGDQSGSTHRFDGTFWTNRLGLSWLLDDGAGRRVSFEIAGRAGENDYLVEDGAVLETIRLELEYSRGAVPYRLGVGDLFADFSRRTLQQQIKGVSVELQPGSGRLNHSILLVAGSGASDWSTAFDGAGRDLVYGGASYLFATPAGRHSVVANVVEVDDRREGELLVYGNRSHRLYSVFGEVALGSARLEGEFAHLEPLSEWQESGDRSFYAQLSQSLGQMSYRLRFEDNGRGFATPGSVGLILDRRIAEVHLRWNAKGRGDLGLRYQAIESEVESVEPRLETEALGARYSGRLLPSRPNLRLLIDAVRNDFTAETGQRDQTFGSVRMELKDRLVSGFEWTLGSKWRALDDHIDPAADRDSAEYSVQLGRRWVRQGSRLFASLGAVHRETGGPAGYRSWSPMIDFSWRCGSQRVGLHLSFLEQDFAVMTTADLQYSTQRLTWAWESGRHRVAVDVGRERRLPDGRQETDSLRSVATYQVTFGEPR